MGIADQISTETAALQQRWETEERWRGVVRPYTAEEVVRLRGRIRETHGFAVEAATKLWDLLATEDYVATLGCLTGNQAVECVKAGLHAIYLSGWQVAADANLSAQTYPDQSLPASRSRPSCSASTTRCAAPIRSRGRRAAGRHLAPIVADARPGSAVR
jgi:isocitrate lyase